VTTRRAAPCRCSRQPARYIFRHDNVYRHLKALNHLDHCLYVNGACRGSIIATTACNLMFACCRANDTGTEVFRNKDYRAAFTHHTQAIRLCPRKATYHCNRAAAALKLQRFSIAATDARYSSHSQPVSQTVSAKPHFSCYWHCSRFAVSTAISTP